MWPFAPRSPLPSPKLPRISRADPGFDLAWSTYDFQRALYDGSDARAWARWHRQWATAFSMTWGAWTAFMLWPSSNRLHPVSPLLLVACLVAQALWFALEVRGCLVKAWEADASEAEADEAVADAEIRISKAAKELLRGSITADEAVNPSSPANPSSPPDTATP